MKPDLAVDLKSVTVSFGSGQPPVLANIDLSITRGEFVVIIGRSGCGKTTILNLLTGLVSQGAGSVEVLGRPPKEGRDRMSYMLARDALMPWRSALRNVELGLELRSMPRRVRREKAKALLGSLGVGGRESAYPWQLSQGMRQRVALARTWATGPDILLMDEPFSALDAQTRVSVQDEFLKLWMEARSTVVFVTHDLAEAVFLADRVVVVADGRISRDMRIPFPRPRDIESLQLDPEYTGLIEDLRTAIR